MDVMRLARAGVLRARAVDVRRAITGRALRYLLGMLSVY